MAGGEEDNRCGQVTIFDWMITKPMGTVYFPDWSKIRPIRGMEKDKILFCVGLLAILTLVYNLKRVDTCIDLSLHMESEMLRTTSSKYLTISILSAPRPKTQVHLLTTIESLLNQLDDNLLLRNNV
jgi:hypothetical protein